MKQTSVTALYQVFVLLIRYHRGADIEFTSCSAKFLHTALVTPITQLMGTKSVISFFLANTEGDMNTSFFMADATQVGFLYNRNIVMESQLFEHLTLFQLLK